jgi:hypothetical protein
MHISKRARLCTALLTTLLLVFALAAARPVRSDTGYAALLVIFGPDDYHSECVALPGDMTPLGVHARAHRGAWPNRRRTL